MLEFKSFIPKNKKGLGISDIHPIVMTIALVGLLIAVMLMIFSSWTDTTATNSVTIYNESVTPSVGGTKVASATKCGFNTFAVSLALNDTTVISSGNYSVDVDAGTITNLTSEYPDYAWSLTYSYKAGGSDCDAMEDVTEAFVDFIPWISVILLIVAAAIVLGIIVNTFAGRRETI